ncbi:hypothetical protein [Streptomyces rubellomurinus]|uniref:PknH-like extracellular domain-containing protein n=1 Tax=Streptomyces rubellomurinus (strain ATCC 31215) TaxID=359131 RepID=A0A0F2T3M5_STRR3|nr:hypothetical protein [Streptomyces rubellomurinus]KJS57844.1 hypothetical protein VM95_37140 [Streptomyces rubellomurinus]
MRSTRIALAAAVVAPLALTLVACGPGDDPSPAASSPATGAASKAPTGAAPTTSGPGKAAAAKPLTQDQLVKALLTKKDLDADENRSVVGPPQHEHKQTADKPACQPVLDLDDPGNAAQAPAASATGAYYGGNGREYVEIHLTQYAPGQAEKAMAAAESALASCASFKDTMTNMPQPTTRAKFSKATYDTIGDATLALKAEYHEDGGQNALVETKTYVFVRTGDVITMVADSALHDTAMPDRAQVKQQLDKLNKAAQQG